jgi:hypothetical protein
MPESIEGDDRNYQPNVRFWESLIPKSKGSGGRMAPQKHEEEHRSHNYSLGLILYFLSALWLLCSSLCFCGLVYAFVSLRPVTLIVYM